MKVDDLDACPACGGEITWGYGLAGGGVDRGDGTEPGAYWMCLDCAAYEEPALEDA